MKIKLYAIAAFLSMLAACAAKPENIAASYVSELSYQTWTCSQLGLEQLRVEQALADASAQQDKA